MSLGWEKIQTEGWEYSGDGVFHANNQNWSSKTSAYHIQESHWLT